ncbi:phage antirepressor [Intestinibacillus sp. Marseille-P6563]|uniref:phage antirepressor n=1 Tax=Intestinibacillus sp. Marseille-P6563 TaxID=2364792 RepID=UPI000F05386B|nr:phage antirepressor [Intestinibacillus sp. Marseille-P6563]
MENKIELFRNEEFGEIRVVEIDEQPWFVGKDVASILGYAKPLNALATHVDDDDSLKWGLTDSLGRMQETIIINESGLYSLVLSSKLPTAKKFKRWVTSEVLPSIRKHGAYMTDDTIEQILSDPDTIIRLATDLKEERAKRKALESENEQQRQVIKDFEPIKQYVDTILESTGTLATSQVAADYDLSARMLNKILHEEGIQHNVNGQWILYRKYMGMGYTKSKTINITRSDGSPDTKLHTQWTQKGRMMIHEILTRRGIQAVMDRNIA